MASSAPGPHTAGGGFIERETWVNITHRTLPQSAKILSQSKNGNSDMKRGRQRSTVPMSAKRGLAVPVRMSSSRHAKEPISSEHLSPATRAGLKANLIAERKAAILWLRMGTPRWRVAERFGVSPYVFDVVLRRR